MDVSLKFRLESRIPARQARFSEAFLSGMSHRLRTPLNHVIGFAELALETLEGAGLEEARQDLSQVLKSGRELDKVLGDLLEVLRKA